MYKIFFKHIIDFFTALSILLIASPFLIITTLLLALANTGNPFFFQKRPGKNEKIFRIVKFRTMTNQRDEKGELLSDAERLTVIGKFVRRMSIDEIPQLINVVKGDMSLIGPRPLLPEYLDLYTTFQKQRHDVRPGITGWAAVNGRNSIDWDKKLELDVWYVNNLNFKLDMKILFKTIKKVLISEGVNAEGHPTMPRFTEYVKQKNNL